MAKFNPVIVGSDEIPSLPADLLVEACRAAATLLPFEGDILEKKIDGFFCFCDHNGCGVETEDEEVIRFYPWVEGSTCPLIIEI